MPHTHCPRARRLRYVFSHTYTLLLYLIIIYYQLYYFNFVVDLSNNSLFFFSFSASTTRAGVYCMSLALRELTPPPAEANVTTTRLQPGMRSPLCAFCVFHSLLVRVSAPVDVSVCDFVRVCTFARVRNFWLRAFS